MYVSNKVLNALQNRICKMKNIKFGIHTRYTISTGSAAANNYIPLNDHEFLATSRGGMYKCEGEVVKKSYTYKFCTSILIKEYNFVAGVSAVGGELFVMMIDDLENPLISNFKTDHIGVFHVLYSYRSHLLITVGSGIYVWNFDVEMPNRITTIHRPKVNITLRNKFALDFDTSILNPPSFDYDSELIYMPTKNGFSGFDLEGKEVKSFSKCEATAQTASSLCLENKKFLTARHADGFHLWTRSGSLLKKIPGGLSSILAIRFIDKHFALFMDSNLLVSIIDINTSKFFHCLTFASKPSVLKVLKYVNKYFLVVCQGSNITMMEIVIPWTVWKGMTTQPHLIKRCPKFNEAARILTFCKSSIFQFISPKTTKNLTSAVDTMPTAPLFYMYDRGLYMEYIFDENHNYIEKTTIFEICPENKRDMLFVTTNDAHTTIFSTGDNPCKIFKIIEMQITSIAICQLNDKFMYCFSNNQGELLFHDYNDFLEYKHTLIQKQPINNVLYHRESASIIVVFQKEMRRFDLNLFKAGEKIPIKDGSYSVICGDMILFGCKTGFIDVYYIKDTQIVPLRDNFSHFHDDAITSFAFAPTFFITSSLDHVIKVWNYHLGLIGEVIFPFPLFACEILNGFHDVLVGTDNEILEVKGTTAFGDEIEDEVKAIDNYDQLSDQLSNQLMEFKQKEEEIPEASFLEGRTKNTSDDPKAQTYQPNKLGAKIKRFNELNRSLKVNSFENSFDDKKIREQMSEEERNRKFFEMNMINDRAQNESLQAKIREEERKKKQIEETENKKKLQEEEEAENKKQEEEKARKDAENEAEQMKKKRKKVKKVKKDSNTSGNESANMSDDEKNKNNKENDKSFDFDSKLKNSDVILHDTKNLNNEIPKPKKEPIEMAVKKPSAPRPSRPFRNNNINGASKTEAPKDINELNNIKDEEEEVGSQEDQKGVKLPKNQGANGPRRRKRIANKSNTNNVSNNENGINEESNSQQQNEAGDEINSNNNENESNDDYDYEDEDQNGTYNDPNQQNKGMRAQIKTQTSNLSNSDEVGCEDLNNQSGVKRRIHQNIPSAGERIDHNIFPENTNPKNNNNFNDINNNQKTYSSSKRNMNKRNKGQMSYNNNKGNKNEDDSSDNQKMSHNHNKNNKNYNNKKNNSNSKNGNKEYYRDNEQQNSDNDDNNSPNNNYNDRKISDNIDKMRRNGDTIYRYSSNGRFFGVTQPEESLSTKFGHPRYPTPTPRYPKSSVIQRIDRNIRRPLFRCRTPPVFHVKPLFILPGPEIHLDINAVIQRILEGRSELIPLLQRFTQEERISAVQTIKEQHHRFHSHDAENSVTVPEPNMLSSYYEVNANYRNDVQNLNQSSVIIKPRIYGNTENSDQQNSKQYNVKPIQSDEVRALQFSYPPREPSPSRIIRLIVEPPKTTKSSDISNNNNNINTNDNNNKNNSNNKSNNSDIPKVRYVDNPIFAENYNFDKINRISTANNPVSNSNFNVNSSNNKDDIVTNGQLNHHHSNASLLLNNDSCNEKSNERNFVVDGISLLNNNNKQSLHSPRQQPLNQQKFLGLLLLRQNEPIRPLNTQFRTSLDQKNNGNEFADIPSFSSSARKKIFQHNQKHIKFLQQQHPHLISSSHQMSPLTSRRAHPFNQPDLRPLVSVQQVSKSADGNQKIKLNDGNARSKSPPALFRPKLPIKCKSKATKNVFQGLYNVGS